MSPRRRRGRPVCRDCKRPVVWFRSAADGRPRKFEPAPVDRTRSAVIAFPVENGARWWWPRDLVEDLMVRHQHSPGEAQVEADAMPWYRPHDCPKRPDQQEDQLSTQQPADDAAGGRL